MNSVLAVVEPHPVGFKSTVDPWVSVVGSPQPAVARSGSGKSTSWRLGADATAARCPETPTCTPAATPVTAASTRPAPRDQPAPTADADHHDATPRPHAATPATRRPWPLNRLSRTNQPP